jgi:hypothetical protein
MTSGLADDPSMADWISAIGQAIGAIFTAFAVAVALWIARRDGRMRKSDEISRLRAQARLIKVTSVRLIPGAMNPDDANEPNYFILQLWNFSSRPIIDLSIHLFIERIDVPKCWGRVAYWKTLDMVQSNDHGSFQIDVNDSVVITGWRLYWADPDGEEWTLESQHDEATRYDPARPHQTTCRLRPDPVFLEEEIPDEFMLDRVSDRARGSRVSNRLLVEHVVPQRGRLR